MSHPTLAAGERGGRAYDHRIIARLARYTRPYWRPLAAALALLPIGAAVQLVPPYLLKRAIDDAIMPGQLELLPPIALLLLGVFVVQHITLFGHTFLLMVVGQQAMHDLRVEAHRHVISLHLRFFDRTPVGSLVTRATNDIESIAEAFASGIVTAAGDLLKLIGIIIAMFWLDAGLAATTLAVLPLLLLVVAVFQRLLRRTYRLIRGRLAAINATLQEQIAGMKVIQVFGRERRAIDAFDRVNRDYRDSYHSAIVFDASLYALVEMIGTITVALLLWWGSARVSEGLITLGLIVAFVEYVQRFFEPIRDMSAKYAVMQQAMAAAERVFGLLDSEDPDAAARAPAPAARPREQSAEPRRPAAVEFREVGFAYDEQRPVLSRLSFTVAPGEVLGIVGATAAGKSTIARLLIRLYQASEGAILLDGQDVRELDPARLRRRVVVLNQEVFLFEGSVADNITLHDPAIEPDRVERVAARLGLSARLALDREVGARGSQLSVGERQLVLFARALVRQPEVLVLDEATASVDPESELLVQRGVAELVAQQTTIVIAHRLSTIENADRILVLHRGEVEQTGTHAQLLEAGGLYAELYRLQFLATTD